MPIEVPNTHLFRDPSFAEAEVAKHFSQWLDVGEEMLVYGSDLLLRSMRTNHGSVEDLVVIGSVFRQLLASADGCLICLRAGAVQGAMLHSRAEFEASMALEWILTKGKAHWARQFYVSSLRQTRMWMRQVVPGTNEYAARQAAWANVPQAPSFTAEQTIQATTDIGAIDALLSTPSYKAINDAFERQSIVGKGAKRRRVEPHWYGPGGVPTISAMARDLGRQGEYASIYRYLSYFVHGSLAENSFKVSGSHASIEPIRYLKQFSIAFNGTFMSVAQALHRITAEYRSGELPQLREHYEADWKAALAKFAQVTVNPQIVTF